ncbi:hypothetical protein KOW79_021447 [Hemibagrus wyckioides]|uniref:Ig-like domain-containing protein n=1 Tax=Hemibagrus wyckioides TaxID=337641 RepID=A0A9D3N5X9_9TELE|nr:hypothetical protein KOW79_021447 [Hemibagrus wyckioides]
MSAAYRCGTGDRSEVGLEQINLVSNCNACKKQWYRAQRFKGLPQDLRKDPEYSGRVFVNTWWSDCELTVKNVRVSDSGVYNFRIKTQSSWISASSGVQLTVTGLKVTVSGQYNWKKLSCATTCNLSNKPIYIWYKNGQRVSEQYINELDVSSWEAGSYSCAVKGHEELRSPAVCVFDKSCWSVTYSTQTICSLIGSSVDIHSYYTFPNNYQVTKVEWFINELEDVREDVEYQDRVQYTNSSQNDCSLRITDLRERDAQTYRFRFHTDRVTHTGESGVTLSVTGLKVTVSGQYNWKKLSCATTCSLSNKPIYIWYKNGQRVSEQYINELGVSSWEAGSYSCAVKGHEELRSPAVCVFDKSCWSVTYSTQTICSLIGSSVDIHSYYTFPNNYQVTKVEWFINELEDVREDEEYQGRVQYTNSSQNDCSLRITDLRERDAQTYRFRFHTDRVTHTGESGVTLSVTGLKVTVSGQYNWKKLSCATTCSLSNKTHLYLVTKVVWFINELEDVREDVEYQGRVQYTNSSQNDCSLRITDLRERDAQTYRFRFYTDRVTHTGESGVTLSVTGLQVTVSDWYNGYKKLNCITTCTLSNNPTYIWYKNGQRVTDQYRNELYFLSNDAGSYSCAVRGHEALHSPAVSKNGFGSSSSSEWAYTSGSRTMKYVASGFTLALVLSFIAVILWMRKRAPVLRTRSEEYSKNDSAPVYSNVSAMTSDPTQTASSEDQDTVQYSSVFFRHSHTQEVPLYSTVQLPKSLSEEQEVEYATVSLVKSRAVREDKIYNNVEIQEIRRV